MGVQVTLEDGEKIDGEEFVIGMAASELSYIEEEEAFKGMDNCVQNKFCEGSRREQRSKRQRPVSGLHFQRRAGKK